MTREDALRMLGEFRDAVRWWAAYVCFILGWGWVGAAVLLSVTKPPMPSVSIPADFLFVLVFASCGFLVLYIREIVLKVCRAFTPRQP